MNKRIFLLMLIVFLAKETKADNYAPVVRIENPKNYSKFKVKEEITFQGKATDLEDEELSGKSLIWTSDVDGHIGEGNSFKVTLSEGSHIIILTATDLEGSLGRDSVFITVGISKITKPIEEVEKSKIEKQAIPSIVFLFVPPFGSFENLQGRVLNADPNEFAVAVYIMVDGVWWSKLVIKINKDEKWVCDITTAENDELAIKIAAYLIPIDYQPPLASGDFWIVKEIEEKCLAKIEVTREIRESIKTEKLILSQEESEMRSHFPLAVGNFWTYKRTVNSSPLHSFGYRVKEDLGGQGREGARIQIIGCEPSVNSGQERYNVIAENKDEDGFEISVKDLNLEDGEGDLADGRYAFEELDKVIWVIRKYSTGTVAVWEIREGIYFGNYVQSSDYLALLTPNIGLGIKPSIDKEGKKVYEKEIISEKYNGEVEVPAGKFRNCIRNTKKFIGGPKFENITNIDFYAKNVGLIQEIQYNSKGEITYKLELIDYNVDTKALK